MTNAALRSPAMTLEAEEQTWVSVPGMRQLASLPVRLRPAT
jgi:hypothetical protein